MAKAMELVSMLPTLPQLVLLPLTEEEEESMQVVDAAVWHWSSSTDFNLIEDAV